MLRATVPDDGDGPRRAIAEAEALGADVVVFSGGVSAGAYEVVKNTLADAWRSRRCGCSPASRRASASTDGMLLFGLPGNPVSAAVSFEVFVRPALLKLQGRTDLHRPVIRLAAATGWRTPAGPHAVPPGRDRPHRPRARGAPCRPPAGGSHLAGGLGRAEAYAVVPAEVDAVAAGDLVDVMLIS